MTDQPITTSGDDTEGPMPEVPATDADTQGHGLAHPFTDDPENTDSNERGHNLPYTEDPEGNDSGVRGGHLP